MNLFGIGMKRKKLLSVVMRRKLPAKVTGNFTNLRTAIAQANFGKVLTLRIREVIFGGRVVVYSNGIYPGETDATNTYIELSYLKFE